MAEAAVRDETLGNLPEWDLSDLYSGIDSPSLDKDFTQAESDAAAFCARFEGKVAGLDGAALGEAIAEYEALQEIIHRIMSYAGLIYASDMTDADIAQFYQGAQERTTDISAKMIFFALEINRIDEENLTEKLKAPALAHYGPWLRDVRAFRPHQLSDELEKALHEKSVTGRAAWNRLFDETMAGLTFPVEEAGEVLELTESEALHRLSDADPAKRKAAAAGLSKVFGDNIRLFSLVTNTLAKDKAVEDGWRAFATPMDSRHLSNQVEGEVVEALVSAVSDAYPRLSHRYYALKAKWLGMDKLNFWDRNAPLPEDDDRIIPWEEACDTVLGAYRAFSPELADIGSRFFVNSGGDHANKRGWIDAPVRPGKASGAFAHPTVPSAHPYLLLNYQGKTRDVMTLAHELGHGVHQILSGGQGALMSDTPLTLAETASVFGEMLTFRSMLDNETDPVRRRIMLAGKVEDMINTVVRQIAFYQFEVQVHSERAGGELTPERLGDIWMDIQRTSLGPAIAEDDNYRNWWSYIPHFVHSPFYVYAYAFGDCLVNSLYAVFGEAEAGFQDKYLDMLRAGGTLRHKELLAPFGLDASEPEFWSRGLGLLTGFIDELEAE